MVFKVGEALLRYTNKKYQAKVQVETWNKRINEYGQKKILEKDTIYNDGEFLMIGDETLIVDVVRKGEGKEIRSKGDTLFSSDYVMFLGEANKELEIFIKFNQRYRFEDYQTEIYEGELAEPKYSENSLAKRFTSRILEGSQSRPNFAGKLNFINWGCGTACQLGVILNSETGQIYSEEIVTALGYKTQPDSRLFISNYGYFDGHENEWRPFCSYCIPEFYEWDWEEEKLVKL